MRKVLFLILIVTGGYNIAAQSGKEVKAMQIVTKETWNHTNSKSKFLETVEKFDKEGNLIEEIKYNSEEDVKKHTRWTYNENNDKLTETEYDEAGKVISRKEYTYEGSLRTSKKEYNEKGKLVSWKIYKFEFAK